jgi:hypothetical protein
MKKLILGLLGLVLFISCGEFVTEANGRKRWENLYAAGKHSYYKSQPKKFYTIEYDGHEYLALDCESDYSYFITTFTHKANCKYCKK